MTQQTKLKTFLSQRRSIFACRGMHSSDQFVQASVKYVLNPQVNNPKFTLVAKKKFIILEKCDSNA